MPYIKKEDRVNIENRVSYQQTVVDTEGINNAGDLNFAITAILNSYMRRFGQRYQTMNDVVGALEGAKAEFYRRVVAPYEDEKIEENGDVYDFLK